ncbi:MAG TPA: nitroreductase family protein [Candidatus Binataceae bacterium]|nr:nitroreductase family protein [Candidatus Binataceae bacterium]
MKKVNQAPWPSASAAGPRDSVAAPAGMAVVKLPAPRTEGGKPLMEALRLRRSIREFSPQALSAEIQSNLLWAAYGINRYEIGGRTAPCWRNSIIIDLYVVMPNGVWLYDAETHRLLPHLAADIRTETGLQDFVGKAPVNLVYVGRREQMKDLPTWERRLYASVDAAFIGQNVYLFCASEGLATVFHQTLDHGRVGRALQLSHEQFVVFAQTVGYPA